MNCLIKFNCVGTRVAVTFSGMLTRRNDIFNIILSDM